ncbi:MAG TPA: class I SAM-dependent methyltransferase [Gaiellaceae bacterium]|nr:class I SAM-dependent methyltransferase [Gaiellaceae bacterium]
MNDLETIEAYAEAHSSPVGDVLRRLGEETAALPDAQMSVGHLEGMFLRFVVAARKPRRILEIGVYTGWSSIAMASALPAGGELIACDVNEETTAIARRYAEEMGVADRIDYRVGDAKETIAALDGEFDLVFIDAWKDDYVDYYELVLPMLAPDGLILADNTLGGMRGNEGIVRFNDHVLADDRVECVLLPIRDGVTLIRRR